MKSRLLIFIFGATLSRTFAQAETASPPTPAQVLAAQPDEPLLIPALRGLVLLPTESANASDAAATTSAGRGRTGATCPSRRGVPIRRGLPTTLPPWLQHPDRDR